MRSVTQLRLLPLALVFLIAPAVSGSGDDERPAGGPAPNPSFRSANESGNIEPPPGYSAELQQRYDQNVSHAVIAQWLRERNDQAQEAKDRRNYDPQYNRRRRSEYRPIFTPVADASLRPVEIHATRGEHQDAIVITWKPVPNASLYMVSRGSAAGEGMEFIGFTSQPYFVDFQCLANQCQGYQIRAVNQRSQEGPPSEVTCGWRKLDPQIAQRNRWLEELSVELPPRDATETAHLERLQIEGSPQNSPFVPPSGCTCGAEHPAVEVPADALIALDQQWLVQPSLPHRPAVTSPEPTPSTAPPAPSPR